jgi:protein-glutamine gamma-glutamyltransferase
MAPELSRGVRLLTFSLLALAAAATEIAAAETRAVSESLGLAALWVGIAAALGRLAPRPDDGRRVPPWHVLLCLMLLAGAPFFVIEQRLLKDRLHFLRTRRS